MYVGWLVEAPHTRTSCFTFLVPFFSPTKYCVFSLLHTHTPSRSKFIHTRRENIIVLPPPPHSPLSLSPRLCYCQHICSSKPATTLSLSHSFSSFSGKLYDDDDDATVVEAQCSLLPIISLIFCALSLSRRRHHHCFCRTTKQNDTWGYWDRKL